MKNTVDVYKKTQQGNLLGPHGGGGVVGYRNPFYGIRLERPAFCLVTFAKEPRTRKRRNGFMWISHSKRSICEFDKHPQLSIHSHYCDSDMKFSFWDWCVICGVEPHKGPRRIWEIEHDLLSTDLGRNRVGEDVRGNMSSFIGMERRCYIKYIFFNAVRERFG